MHPGTVHCAPVRCAPGRCNLCPRALLLRVVLIFLIISSIIINMRIHVIVNCHARETPAPVHSELPVPPCMLAAICVHPGAVNCDLCPRCALLVLCLRR